MPPTSPTIHILGTPHRSAEPFLDAVLLIANPHAFPPARLQFIGHLLDRPHDTVSQLIAVHACPLEKSGHRMVALLNECEVLIRECLKVLHVLLPSGVSSRKDVLATLKLEEARVTRCHGGPFRGSKIVPSP